MKDRYVLYVHNPDNTSTLVTASGNNLTLRALDHNKIEIRHPKVIIREGSYLPAQLGIYAPKLNWIHVGICPHFEEGQLPYTMIAHAHAESGEICFTDGAYIFSDEGVLDDTFIHEYCHILRGESIRFRRDHPKHNGHDLKWANLMAKYGLLPERYRTYLYGA